MQPMHANMEGTQYGDRWELYAGFEYVARHESNGGASHLFHY